MKMQQKIIYGNILGIPLVLLRYNNKQQQINFINI